MARLRIFAIIVIGMIYMCITESFGAKAKWRVMGCYKIKKDSASKHDLGHVDTSKDPSRIFKKCAKKAEDQGLPYMGIKDGNECWGAKDDEAYDKNSCSQDCDVTGKGKMYGVGKGMANFVYYRMSDWTSCKCGDKKSYKLALVKDRIADCPPYNRKVIPLKQNKKCPKNSQCSVHVKWSNYGPWSACDQVCGHNGKQTRSLQCNGRKGCAGPRQEYRDCNSVNCPEPCSFDGILLQLLHSLNLNISVSNNHLVAAFSQVMDAMNGAGSKTSTSPDLTNELLIKKIKYLLRSTENLSRKIYHARTFLGILLARQKTCDYAEISRELRDEISDEGFKRLLNVDGKVTLTFVIDISGSMKSEIPEATNIVENIAGYTSIANVDYILSTYTSKPEGSKVDGKVQNFDDRKKFINALNRLAKRKYRREKNDCQEPTYTGIIRAITNGYPQRGSPMYVFTDAPPKALRDFTADNAIYHAQKNKIPVSFFLSKPFCGPKTMASYRVIAEATGGLVLTFKKGSSMKRLQRMIKGSLDGTAIVASDRNNRKREIRQYDKAFYIDDIAQEGTLEVEVKDTVADLLTPKNVQIYPETADSSSLFWTILRPPKGTWSFSSQATDMDFEVKSQSKLDITLHWRFMKGTNFIDHPLIGEKAKVEIEVPNISRLDKNTLSLPNDWILLTHNNDFYTYECKAPLSEEHFKIPMRGKTLSGFNFTRESYVIQPKIAVITSLIKPWFSPEVGKEFQYRASISYANAQPMTFRIKLVVNFGGDRYNDDADNYEDITLSRGEKRVSWNLTAPTKGQFNAKIKLKTDDVEINFEDGPFLIKEN